MSVAPVLPSSGSLSMSTIRNAMGNSGVVSVASIYKKAGITGASNISISNFRNKPHALEPGFLYRTFAGYFGNTTSTAPGTDDITWFDTKTEVASGLVTDMSNVNTSTGGNYTSSGSGGTSTYFSVDWFGYFFAPTTETYTFTLTADDAAYLWIGSTALSGALYTNALINNGNLHGYSAVSGTIALTAGTYYPIRIVFGQNAGGYDFTASFSTPTITSTSNFSGYVFYPLGTLSTHPAPAARLIKKAWTTTTDGAYYINCNGVSTLTYCLMDNKWDGGGWMMAMKATRGTTFNYSSTYWTDAGSTLNTGDVTRNDADAKFSIMNACMMKDVLALWPDVGVTGGSIAQTDSWAWLVNGYYSSGTRCTMITGFSNANTRDSPVSSDPYAFNGYNTTVWSGQNPSRRHVFGGGTHLTGPPTSAAGTYGIPNNLMRWGFIFNENQPDNFTSSDAAGGIGMQINWGSAASSFSAGDFVGCCQNYTGLNRSMRVEVYGR